MTTTERALRFACAGESLVGVLSMPEEPVRDIGVVIAVGGPQYRAGSHRQFVMLARRLAWAGYPALRFDTRGMGDSTGDFPGFASLGLDIEAAVRAMQTEVPTVRRVVMWGLCDAASALLMSASTTPALAGLVLVNPWVRHVDTQARTEVKHYYGKRLYDLEFWRKLLAGRVGVGVALREVSVKLWRMGRSYLKPAVEPADYRERMAHGALGSAVPQLYLMSGRDHVCAEFLEYSSTHAQLRDLWQRPGVERVDLPTADHTFSSRELRGQVEDATLVWLDRVAGRARE